jgi:hypothetical protein
MLKELAPVEDGLLVEAAVRLEELLEEVLLHHTPFLIR